MRGFTASQADILARGGLPLEMLCALLSNNLDAYSQSLEFGEHVQVGRRNTRLTPRALGGCCAVRQRRCMTALARRRQAG